MRAYLAASAAVLLAAPAFADDWKVDPYTAEFGSVNFSAGGTAWGSLFSASAPGGGQRWASGAADLNLKLEREYDSGLVVALKASFEVARDRLSYDNYGGNLVQKVYGVVQTGLGDIEFGMTDGAAEVLAVTGPVVDPITSIDNPNTTFFIDPSTGRPFVEAFTLSTGLNSSSNYAKLSYYTPRVFGLQIGFSYTPSEGRQVIPFLSNGPHSANRQKSIWETAISYSQAYEDFSLGAYAAAAFAHGDGHGPDDGSLTEWSTGTEIDIPIGEETTFAFGGGYRRSNAGGFDIYAVKNQGTTDSGHLSTTLSWGDWAVGAEYGRGTADLGSVSTNVNGWSLSAAYALTENLRATLGWQELRYSRDTGTWYDGSSRIKMNAVYLALRFKV